MSDPSFERSRLVEYYAFILKLKCCEVLLSFCFKLFLSYGCLLQLLQLYRLLKIGVETSQVGTIIDQSR